MLSHGTSAYAGFGFRAVALQRHVVGSTRQQVKGATGRREIEK